VSEYIFLLFSDFTADDFFSLILLLLPRVNVSQKGIEASMTLFLVWIHIKTWSEGGKVVFEIFLNPLLLNLLL
jgi:hypothetical protein